MSARRSRWAATASWAYSLDTSDWPPGVYTVVALTDDPVGIAQGSDGPETDSKTITVQ
jgi:hypothetical protein